MKLISNRIWNRFLGACIIGAVLAGGCAGPKLVPIKTHNDFEKQVLQSSKPILVEFYKGGCPTCLALEPQMNTLADEYQDQVTIARFELMKPYFAVTSPELKKHYNISFFPTVILFINGEEVNRWVMNYDLDKYRQVLNENIGLDRQKDP
jgi:thioredoxin 1